MFSVMLVDDERDIRIGLASIIDWQSLGFTIVAEATNGREALDVIAREAIHVVITDISMPVLNGLEFIRVLRQNQNNQRVIILSAYNDFEYLKEALKYRVENYLMKPIDEDELKSTLLQVKEDLLYDIELHLREKENLTILRSKILNRLVTNSISKIEFINKADFLKIELTANAYRILLIELESITKLLDRTGERYDSLQLFSAMNVCEEILRQYTDGVIFEDAFQHIIFIEKINRQHPLISYEQIADEIKVKCKKYIKEPASVIIGPEVKTLYSIHASYQETLRLLEYKFYLGREATIHEHNVPRSDSIQDIEMDAKIESLKLAISSRDEASCLRITRELCDDFKKISSIHRSLIHQKTFELLLYGFRLVTEANGDIHQLLQKPDQFYMEIVAKKTIDDIHDFLQEHLSKTLSYMTKLKEQRPAKVILSVLDFMKEHYKEEITLKQVAEMNYINPGYLGKLFKKETQSSFHEYLNKIRIEQAKILLQSTHYFVYQVSEMVGYKDYNYFQKTFKKIVGTTPSEYHP
jgi:two-component system response regulator YesN